MSDGYVDQTTRTSVQVLAWFANKNGGGIGKVKVMKLAYIAERHRMRSSGLSITQDKLSAMPMGPVLSGALNLLNPKKTNKPINAYFSKYLDVVHKEKAHIVTAKAVDEDEFSENDLSSLEWAWNNFGHYNWRKLVDITHELPEWKSRSRVERANTSVGINPEDMLEDLDNEVCKIFPRLSADKKAGLIESIIVQKRIHAALSA